jgi:hypothetical protein
LFCSFYILVPVPVPVMSDAGMEEKIKNVEQFNLEHNNKFTSTCNGRGYGNLTGPDTGTGNDDAHKTNE